MKFGVSSKPKCLEGKHPGTFDGGNGCLFGFLSPPPKHTSSNLVFRPFTGKGQIDCTNIVQKCMEAYSAPTSGWLNHTDPHPPHPRIHQKSQKVVWTKNIADEMNFFNKTIDKLEMK